MRLGAAISDVRTLFIIYVLAAAFPNNPCCPLSAKLFMR